MSKLNLEEVARVVETQIRGTLTSLDVVQSWVPSHGDLGFSFKMQFRTKDKRRRQVAVTGLGDTPEAALRDMLERLKLDEDRTR